MRIDEQLHIRMDRLTDSRVKDAMSYSLFAGGKRIRPNFLYAAAQGYGVALEKADPFACAIEMIQTYSLIHDDLPAMDNDDLRRGKPTCHRQFDEATAILAGDGLLTYAFETAAEPVNDPLTAAAGIRILARMAGPDGMVLGQTLDTLEETGVTDWEQLVNIYHLKTGCLLSAPLMIGAVLAGKGQDTIEKWHAAGNALGVAFQVQDDIMDVELSAQETGKTNSDIRNDKVTGISLLGIEKARALVNDLYEEARGNIASFSDFNSFQLDEMIERIEKRKK